MIHSFKVTNYLGDTIELELKKPMDSGFLVRSVTGLGPVKANINTTELATNDGALFNSARLDKRNIVFDIVFFDTENQETIEDIRQKSYKYFPLKRNLDIVVKTDNRCLKTTGYVESNEPNIFSPQESSQISVICPNPYFYFVNEDGMGDHRETDVDIAAHLFEFPFSNESLIEPLLVLGEINIYRTNQYEELKNIIRYEGDAETGITLHIYVTGSVSGNFKIANNRTQKFMLFNLTAIATKISNTPSPDVSFPEINDEIVICTEKGKKSAKYIRNNKEYNIIDFLSGDSDWLTLVKGDNEFIFGVTSGMRGLRIKIENKVLYEGV